MTPQWSWLPAPDPGQTIGEAWESYFAALVRPGMSREVAVETRRAFYAGTAAVLELLNAAAHDGDVARVVRMKVEVREFAELQRQGIV